MNKQPSLFCPTSMSSFNPSLRSLTLWFRGGALLWRVRLNVVLEGIQLLSMQRLNRAPVV